MHFGTEIRHVGSNNETKKFSVVTQNELVKAMNHGDNIAGCIGEMLYINTKCDQYGMWVKAFSKCGDLMEIGRTNEFRY